MTSYKELLQQRAALEDQIQAARKQELSEAVGKVRTLISEFDLTAEQIFGKGKAVKEKAEGGKVAPKYRDPATGQTWTGRGKPPAWIRDQDRVKFEIQN